MCLKTVSDKLLPIHHLELTQRAFLVKVLLADQEENVHSSPLRLCLLLPTAARRAALLWCKEAIAMPESHSVLANFGWDLSW